MDTDAILAEVLGSESGQTQPTQSSNEPQNQNTDFEVDFTWKGKAQKMPWSKAKSYVQKGYDYEQNIGALKREREEFLSERNQFGDLNRLKELKTIDDFAKANPAFLNLVKHQWELAQRGQPIGTEGATDGTTPNTPSFDPIQSTLQSLVTEVNQLKQERDNQRLEQADTQLDTDLNSLKDIYKTLDWEGPVDSFGNTREHAVLRYIQQYGVDAKKAFWALYGEDVAKTQAEEARQKTLTDVQEKHKRGKFISGALSKPSSFTPSRNVSDRSYDDITKSVMQEYNINY